VSYFDLMRTFAWVSVMVLVLVARANADICDSLESAAKVNPSRLSQLKLKCRSNPQAVDPTPSVTEIQYLDDKSKADMIPMSVTSFNSGAKDGNRFCEVSFIDGRGTMIKRNVIVEPDSSLRITDKNGKEIPVSIDTAPPGNPLFRLAMGPGRADERTQPSADTSSACYVAQRVYQGNAAPAVPGGAPPQ
jgi:hypothetical protein